MMDGWMVFGAIVGALATAVIAILTFQLWRINQRMVWLTGAMESHSAMMVRLAAKEQEVEMIWWDPTTEDWPFTGKHGQPLDLTQIYIGVPLRHRKQQPSRIRKWLRGEP